MKVEICEKCGAVEQDRANLDIRTLNLSMFVAGREDGNEDGIEKQEDGFLKAKIDACKKCRQKMANEGQAIMKPGKFKIHADQFPIARASYHNHHE